MTQYTPISLYHSTRITSALPNKSDWQKEMAEMVKTHLRGEPVFIRYCSDKKRIGSIGRLVEFQDLGQLVNGRPHYLYGNSIPGTIDPASATEADIHPENIQFIRIAMKWDGRSNKTHPDPWNVEWLKDYTGPTVWVLNEPELKQATALDRLGREVKVGDFICYILHHFGRSGASTQFGKVTKITKDGKVFAKNVKLSEHERSEEKKINDNSTIVILTDDLMDQLMLARLRS